jgi:hypothetical protein
MLLGHFAFSYLSWLFSDSLGKFTIVKAHLTATPSLLDSVDEVSVANCEFYSRFEGSTE